MWNDFLPAMFMRYGLPRNTRALGARALLEDHKMSDLKLILFKTVSKRT